MKYSKEEIKILEFIATAESRESMVCEGILCRECPLRKKCNSGRYNRIESTVEEAKRMLNNHAMEELLGEVQ